MFTILLNDNFTFRFEENGPAVHVWFRYADEPELGPVALTAEENEALQEHVEKASALVTNAVLRFNRKPDAGARTGGVSSAGQTKRAVLRLVR